MKWKAYNLVWLLAALVIAVQAVTPAFALAEVSVRCVGTPIASTPCMKTVIPVATNAPRVRCADMSCCRNTASLMRTCNMAADRAVVANSPMSATGQSFSASLCLITIKPLGTTQPITSNNIHRWLLNTAPALAPPVGMPVFVAATPASTGPRPQSISLHSPFCVSSHGLRAPPIA